MLNFFYEKDLKAQNSKFKNSNMNSFLMTTNPLLNDRLRKRRCFADKDLDSVPALSTIIDTMMANSAFRVTGLPYFRPHQYQQETFTETKSRQKKCTDFSVAALIGQS